MPYTYKEWDAVREVALSCFYGGVLASGHERVVTGDIVACRKPLQGIGMAEAGLFLWLRVTTLTDSAELDRLTAQIHDDPDNPTVTYDKRRYCIPLERLQQIYPALDINRVLDPNDKYQPFLGFDEDAGWFLYEHVPLQIEGLVFDKVTGDYI